ncbi:MAG TPA: transcription antitermination factor NusB [candidate division Zixibacteria bacterium]|nr:transcription antitermination factor NusB [candidate division Zixibacteria bacterium]
MQSTPSPRHHARELVLQSLYAIEHGEMEPEEAFEQIVGDQKISTKNREFAKLLYRLAREHSSWADEIIRDLAENWRLERIADIDRTILRMAMIEIEHVPDVPVKVVLNEAIELAKEYSTTESSRFVNGILDRFVKSLKSS